MSDKNQKDNKGGERIVKRYVEIPAEMLIHNKDWKPIAGEKHLILKFNIDDLKEAIKLCKE